MTPLDVGHVKQGHFMKAMGQVSGLPLTPNATLQARGIAGARHERTLFPVALQALVRRCARMDEEIRWDSQVHSKSLNLWERQTAGPL